MPFVLVVTGLLAGALTTLAGQGGGLFLLLVCSVLIGPRDALAVTAPALLLGNLHRAVLFRAHVDRSVAVRMIAGSIPGAFLGGLLAGVVPQVVLQVALVLLTVLAIAKAIGLLRFDVPRGALLPSGFVVGGLTGTSGGAGILFAPVLLAAGLRGRAFVGTIACVAVSAHVGRVVAYASSGFFTRSLVLPIALVTVAIFVGNTLGERIRAKTSEAVTHRLEYGVLVVCVALSLAGVH